MAESATESFAYQAQSAEGHVFSGTIDAKAIGEANRQLQQLKLQVTRLEPTSKPVPATPFRASDFLAFNQQLAQLTAGGMPIERSLRLVAAEVTDKRHAATIHQIAAELEKGTPLASAFAAHTANFPPLYAWLLEAGVRSNNLPAMLLNLGRHVQLMERLRSAWWRAASYPLTVLFCLLLVMGFLWLHVMPQFAPLAYGPLFEKGKWGSYPTGMSGIDPNVARFFLISSWTSYTIMVCIALVLLLVLSLSILSRTATGRQMVDAFVLPLPLIGPVLKWSLIARWCDALHLGVRGGLPLPDALALARDAIQSKKLSADTQSLIDNVNSGASMELDSTTVLLPPLIPASLQMGIERNDLPGAALMLTQMYEEQAEIRLAVLPRVLSPLLLLLTALCLGMAVAAMLLPLLMIIQALAGP